MCLCCEHLQRERIYDEPVWDKSYISEDRNLGIYFKLSEKYFLNLQNDIDIRNIRMKYKDELDQIQALESA